MGTAVLLPQGRNARLNGGGQAFGESLSQFSSLNTCPMGVSPNSVERHRRFLDKLGLRLTLLSNPRKTTIRQYTGTFLGEL
ncbi:MAG: redoxin domain-containing protein [SAR324 cluster bacterium]|nr:redoxin domain-containing protein [SAR324 cluster bacterium]